MAPLVLINAFVYVAGHDFTGDTNEAMVDGEYDVKDATTFRASSSGWKDFARTTRKVAFDEKGFWSSAASDSVDTEAFGDLAVANRVCTIGTAETETSPALLFQAAKFKLSQWGKLGDLAPFQLSGSGTDKSGLVRGQLGKAKGTVSATGALGSGLNLGAVSSTQFLYATFHVFPTAGTTITVVVESATAGTFVGATTRATIGPLTTTGGVWLTPVAGPVTDTWWRFRVSAITGTFLVAGAIAIQ